ncbi:hemicentin-1, partial [Fundulus heteroclitus]|uniref:hemicentin-1 n=1 Tax=Fundulus heteroclitus TaxID=8078 RepID=UPI00165A5ECC
VTLNENITAEAGLCAVIPCSFKSGFEAKVIIWYKCDQLMDRCGDFDKVFHSDKNIENVQSGFKGRVSLLEPDVTQKNCSIMINDLRPSDSGYYQLRVEGEGTGNAWTYTTKTFLCLTDLNQKPKVTIPPLTEGQQATLTCTAPGLCSGSPPKITWMWRRKGEKDSHITGNTTSLKTENLTTLTQRHSSNLTFNISAEHHNSKITCKVSFTGDKTTEKTATLNVTYTKKLQIYGRTTVMEGDDVNLACSVDSFPPSVIKWTNSRTETDRTNNILRKADNSRVTYLQEKSGNVSYSITNITAEEAGPYICTATNQNGNMTEEVHIKVNYKRKPQIFGNTTVKEGDVLNLTCSVDSFPPSVINWTKYKNGTLPKNVSFPIINVTVEDAGRYICTATYLNSTLEEEINVRVTYIRTPRISGNTLVNEGEALNLTCGVDSFPSSVINLTKFKGKTNLQSNISSKLQNSSEESGIVTFPIINVTAEDAGLYICTAKHLDKTLNETINVTVTYQRRPQIDGNPTVKEGDVLNLTCSADSFPPSLIVWTKHSPNLNANNRTFLSNNTGSANLIILNMTVEDSARYICTATYMNKTVAEYVDIEVTWFAKILKGSGCLLRSDVLTCVCISEGFPLPTIKWPLLEDHTEYSVTNMVSNHTVNSTVTVTIETHGNISVECSSSNQNGEAKEKLTVQPEKPNEEDKLSTNLLKGFPLDAVIAFFIGLLLSAIISCLFVACYRRKRKNSVGESLEMISPLISNGQAAHGGQPHRAQALAVATEASSGPKELIYASIDFSLLDRIPRKPAKSSEKTETEYAAIKIIKEKDGDPGEIMIEENSQMKNSVQEAKEEAEEAVYSSVEDLVDRS